MTAVALLVSIALAQPQPERHSILEELDEIRAAYGWVEGGTDISRPRVEVEAAKAAARTAEWVKGCREMGAEWQHNVGILDDLLADMRKAEQSCPDESRVRAFVDFLTKTRVRRESACEFLEEQRKDMERIAQQSRGCESQGSGCAEFETQFRRWADRYKKNEALSLLEEISRVTDQETPPYQRCRAQIPVSSLRDAGPATEEPLTPQQQMLARVFDYESQDLPPLHRMMAGLGKCAEGSDHACRALAAPDIKPFIDVEFLKACSEVHRRKDPACPRFGWVALLRGDTQLYRKTLGKACLEDAFPLACLQLLATEVADPERGRWAMGACRHLGGPLVQPALCAEAADSAFEKGARLSPEAVVQEFCGRLETQRDCRELEARLRQPGHKSALGRWLMARCANNSPEACWEAGAALLLPDPERDTWPASTIAQNRGTAPVYVAALNRARPGMGTRWATAMCAELGSAMPCTLLHRQGASTYLQLARTACTDHLSTESCAEHLFAAVAAEQKPIVAALVRRACVAGIEPVCSGRVLEEAWRTSQCRGDGRCDWLLVALEWGAALETKAVRELLVERCQQTSTQRACAWLTAHPVAPVP